MEVSPVFDIRKLHEHEQRRVHEKQKLYNRILVRAHRRIEAAAPHVSYCVFQVPEFILGMPLYDAYQCCGYVIQKLTSDGFHVQHYQPNILHINWAVAAARAATRARSEPPRPAPPPPLIPPPSLIPPPPPKNLSYIPTGKLFM